MLKNISYHLTNNIAIIFVLMLLALPQNQAKQNLISGSSNDQSTIDKGQLVQIFVFFRHGHYVPSYMFYEGEYISYDISGIPFEQATYLGNSESWAMGKLLKETYPDFFDQILSEKVDLVMGEFLRSQENAEHLFCGLVGNYPEWDYDEIASLVIEAVKSEGYCEECPETYYVPINEIITNGYVNESSQTQPLLDIQTDTDFFDIDEDCEIIDDATATFLLQVFEFVEEEFGIVISDGAWDEYQETLISYQDDPADFGLLILISMYHTHLMHNLDSFEISDESIENLLILDVWDYMYTSLFEDYFDEDLYIASLYDSLIIEDVLSKLYGYTDDDDDAYKLVVYMMHDNNLFAINQILLDSLPDYPQYSSSVRILVYEKDDGSLYVNALFDGEIFTISGCEENCPIETYYSILDNVIIEAREECDAY